MIYIPKFLGSTGTDTKAVLPVESAQSKTSALPMSNQALDLLTFVLYSVLAILFWRAQAAGNAEQQNRGALGFAVIVPLALHGWQLYQTLFIWGALNLGLVYALSLILWLTVLVYWLARYFYPLSSLQTLVLPLAAISAALPAFFRLPTLCPSLHPACSIPMC
jgi:ABC-type uncharacterized transport system permease subunit